MLTTANIPLQMPSKRKSTRKTATVKAENEEHYAAKRTKLMKLKVSPGAKVKASDSGANSKLQYLLNFTQLTQR